AGTRRGTRLRAVYVPAFHPAGGPPRRNGRRCRCLHPGGVRQRLLRDVPGLQHHLLQLSDGLRCAPGRRGQLLPGPRPGQNRRAGPVCRRPRTAQGGLSTPMTTTMGTQVTVRNFGYRHASRKKPAFSNITLDIAPGERVLLTGDSGSGKSTLLAALAGVLGDDTEGQTYGSLLVDASSTGLVLQDPDSQVIASRVGDDVAFVCEDLGIPREGRWQRVEQALVMFGRDLPLGHPRRQLSGV